jgi:glycosyltransferase involved in cell wall biosynthesis
MMNFAYGYESQGASINGNYYDRVIPNYFDPADIEYSENKEDYYLFIGRMIQRKGILTALKTCELIGKKLIIVGQGGLVLDDGSLTATTNPDFWFPAGLWEYRGFADVQARRTLMAHARAVFTPTEYLEPFAGTHVEAMLAGTPPITTNFGVFGGDTFINNVHGFKCNTLEDFVWAAQNARKLDPKIIRINGEKFLMDNVKLEFQRWFDDLHQVYLSAMNPNIKGWHNIRQEKPEWRIDL